MVLSLCMIVRNEAARLARCLDSVAGVAGEIVVVDTGSTDATIDLARERGARVLHHDFRTVDFAAARNAGLSAVTGEHVLVLDADESLDPVSAPIVRGLVEAGDHAGRIVARRNIPAEPGKSAWFDHAVRLFPRNSRFRYAGAVHETIDASILAAGARLRRSEIVVDHHLAPEAELRAKARRYLALLEAESSDDPDRLVFLAAEYHKLGRFADATAVAERAAALVPGDADVHVTAALYHFCYAGEPDRARADLATALRLDAGHAEARRLLAVLATNEADRAGRDEVAKTELEGC